MRRTAVTALVALLVALAGCGAASQGLTTTTQTDSPSSDAVAPSGGSVDGPAGTIAFYLSDQPAAIDDFEHLNVTIEKVGLHRTDSGDEMDDGDTDDGANETTTTTVTTTANNTTETTSTVTTTETSSDETTTTAGATTTETTDDDGAEADDSDDGADEQDGDNASEDAEDGERNESDDGQTGNWVTYQVANKTVDLTELKGANATRLANLSAPAGTYDTVFVYVSDISGVLENGEEVNVKLPSQKLQIHTTVDIGPNASTDFVYDIAVHEAGKSGKYILKPNIAESGTQVQIRDVDREHDRDRDRADETEDDEQASENDEKASEDEQGADDEKQASENDEKASEDEQAGEDEKQASGDEEQADNHDEAEAAQNDTEEAPEEDPGKHEDDEGQSAAGFEVSLLDSANVTTGEPATVSVTANGTGVAGARVDVNDERVGTTGADGRLEFDVPDGAEEVEIVVTKGDREAEVTIELDSE